ncbi:MAG: 5-methyltetrahydropteroyltriglutamate--homocysteine S-methyltransferase [Gammaproteobacteria bacterium]|nr:5-methyltetrahydropteroyltriglutamate--homocysteine S-methyltransferase [Gammaproteobacteria bacterium]MDH5344815.1 5-methyltetrahydropteroyltriglutamate--homocysteine S-methyltransferase [Gammaproteobacteria bacterium]
MTATAPFRADHVGSLLRPAAVHNARIKYHAEQLGPDGFHTTAALTAVENEAIKEVVAMQESVGLKAVTDGELRRSFWHYDFMGALTGLELVERDVGVKFHGIDLRPIFPTITGPLDFPDDHPMLGHFRYLASVSNAQPKISIPGPSACHFRTAKEDIAPPEYADLDVLFADLAKTYRKAVNAFYDAGCRYLQMDDIFFAYLCDPKHRAEKKAAGMDPDWLITQYAKTMHDAIDGRPDDMVIAMHLCRGNFQSTWAAEGAYDPAADAVFNQTGIDIYFMEYDTDRAGGLEPLRLLPKGSKRVMPGFITTKTPELELIDDLKKRFEEASKYADIDQLGIAPQCGFASTEEGNKLTFEDQKRKLELVVATAEAIWGEV